MFAFFCSGISVPRGSLLVNGSDGFDQGLLPSARSISTAVIADIDNPSDDYTLLLMQWGQFLDHDITFTPLVKGTLVTKKIKMVQPGTSSIRE